jgi:hypothetical protein
LELPCKIQVHSLAISISGGEEREEETKRGRSNKMGITLEKKCELKRMLCQRKLQRVGGWGMDLE